MGGELRWLRNGIGRGKGAGLLARVFWEGMDVGISRALCREGSGGWWIVVEA